MLVHIKSYQDDHGNALQEGAGPSTPYGSFVSYETNHDGDPYLELAEVEDLALDELNIRSVVMLMLCVCRTMADLSNVAFLEGKL
jgi:hypothetical protein